MLEEHCTCVFLNPGLEVSSPLPQLFLCWKACWIINCSFITTLTISESWIVFIFTVFFSPPSPLFSVFNCNHYIGKNTDAEKLQLPRVYGEWMLSTHHLAHHNPLTTTFSIYSHYIQFGFKLDPEFHRCFLPIWTITCFILHTFGL